MIRILFSMAALSVPGLAYASNPSAPFSDQLVPAAPVIAAVAAVAATWVRARNGRKVRLKFGSVEAEARTPEEIGELLKRVGEFEEEANSRPAPFRPAPPTNSST
jgi:hypothetical protein